MVIWNGFVGLIATILFALTQIYGGSYGLAIITLSLTLRLALLPLTISIARRAISRQGQLKALQPELEQLQKRYQTNPELLTQEMKALYQRHGYSLIDGRSLFGGFLQI